jgi:hypothetical protein
VVNNGFRRGDPKTGPDEGRQEAVKVHVRETRHAMIATGGFGEIAGTGQRVRIIVKGFIEVPDAQEKKHAGVLAFQPGVLVEKIRLQSSCPVSRRFRHAPSDGDEMCRSSPYHSTERAKVKYEKCI